MAILKKCAECERLGGYAIEATDEICARCMRSADAPKSRKKKDEDEDDE